MKKIALLFFIMLNFCGFSQSKCPDEIQNFTGRCCEFHLNGKISQQKEYKKGKLVGEIQYYDEKGYIVLNKNQKTDENLNENFAESNPNEDVEVEKDEIYNFVDKDAEFKGGQMEMNKFISENFKYPTSFKGQGKVYAKFVIENDGSVSQVQIVREIPDCEACSNEVIRILKSMPKWIPGKLGGKAIRSYVQIPFNFLPK